MSIKHYFLCGKTLSETNLKLDKYYLYSASSYGKVQTCFAEFCHGRTCTETIPSPGHPNEITTPEIINKIHDIVLNVPKVKLLEIAEIVSIWTDRMVNILHTHLCMRKLCARWVLRFFTVNQKRIRVTTSEQNLAHLNRNLKEFLCRFITMDETWIHHYYAYSTAYYAAILHCLADEIRKKWPYLKKKEILSHAKNALPHTSIFAQAKKHKLVFESRPHSPCSLNLAPSDYILSQTSRDGYVVGVSSWRKKLNGKQKGILEGFAKHIIWKS